jgi:peptide/nickel transport system permease protein
MTLRVVASWVLRLVAVALMVGLLCFVITWNLPGDMAMRVAAARYGYDWVGQDAAAAVRAQLQLDAGWPRALWRWLVDLAQGRLGESLVTGEPVWHEVAHQLGATLHLSAAAMLVALALGLPLGAAAAARAGSIWDRGLLAAASILKATPSFLLALVLMLAVGASTGLLPVGGHGHAASVVLPALALGLGVGAGLAQVVRDALVRVQTSPAVLYARIKGLPEPALRWPHLARPAASGVLAYVAAQLVVLIEGAVVVETLFAWPGIGHALVHAIFGRDVPMVQGIALVMALLFVLLSAALDAALARLDPRWRNEVAV